MNLVTTVGDVFEGVQRAKSGATQFCTNFFPVQSKLEAWIANRELLCAEGEGGIFFFRKEGDFFRLYFCSPSPAALRAAAASLPELQSGPVVADLVGAEAGAMELASLLSDAGFRTRARLQRMAGRGRIDDKPGESSVALALPQQCAAILDILESNFDRYAEQLPTAGEVEAAVQQRQILVVQVEEKLAGLLFFETQGLTSLLRFWAVSAEYRSLRIGSMLMSHYFRMHPAVRRFNLWVNTANLGAIQKYCHYGYAADSLIDIVVVNRMVSI